MPTLSPKVIAALVGVLLVILAALFLPGLISSLFSAKQEARTAKGQAEASIESGAEAMNTVSNVAEAAEETRQAEKEGRDDILSQPPGNSNAAAVRAACRMRINQHRERCAALRRADTGKPQADR